MTAQAVFGEIAAKLEAGDWYAQAALWKLAGEPGLADDSYRIAMSWVGGHVKWLDGSVSQIAQSDRRFFDRERAAMDFCKESMPGCWWEMSSRGGREVPAGEWLALVVIHEGTSSWTGLSKDPGYAFLAAIARFLASRAEASESGM